MHVEAVPMHLLALTDGVRAGQEHILLVLLQSEPFLMQAVALSLDDGELLLAGLRRLLPVARQLQADLPSPHRGRS